MSSARQPSRARDLDQAGGVGRVGRADDKEQVAPVGDPPHGVLAVLGGVADVVGGRRRDRGNAPAQGRDDLGGLVGGKRRLGEICDAAVRPSSSKVGDVVRRRSTSGSGPAPRRACRSTSSWSAWPMRTSS